MASRTPRPRRPAPPAPRGAHPETLGADPEATGADPELLAVFDELQRILDSPLVELVGSEELGAEAEQLERQAVAAPAMERLREVVAFVGTGRPATQVGNLKPADAVALARRLAPGEPIPDPVRSMDDLPATAHAFRWAAACEFLAWRGTKIVAGPRAPDLEGDALSAWFSAAGALLDQGLLGGFREGWHKPYVELLDTEVGGLLAGLAEAGGTATVAVIEEQGWTLVADTYGYDPDDAAERAHVARLIATMIQQLADLGAVIRDGDDVVLTEVGTTLALIASLTDDDGDDDDIDLVDTDAQSLLLVCTEEMEPDEAAEHLAAWCRARRADQAADELCEALLDDDDPAVWALGLEALSMLDRSVAEPVVRELRSHPDLGAMASEWLRAR